VNQSTTVPIVGPSVPRDDPLTEILRRGARTLLAHAIEAEVAAYLGARAHLKDESGRQQVVRKGHLPERTILTGVGPVELKRPRVRDRRPVGQREAFSSAILPPYLRKTRSLEDLIRWLYLKGVSTGDITDALKALLGPGSPGLSATTVTRLKAGWEAELAAWGQRSLKGKHYVYVWADGVHFNIRLEEDRQCILVLMGATADGQKELIAVADGYRESEQSWKELLLDVKARGLEIGVLDKPPKGVQPKAKAALHEIYEAEGREVAERAFDRFVAIYEANYPKAVECLVKDRGAMLVVYDFPAEHWRHIRTTNPIESTFATVRLRHGRTKGSGSRVACLTMVDKLMEAASKKWRLLNGSGRLRDVILTRVDPAQFDGDGTDVGHGVP
jgi:putative transposase